MAVDVDGQQLLSTSSKSAILSDAFWARLNGVLNLLKPISEWITRIESDKPQLSLIARLFVELATHCENTLPDTTLTKQEHKAILSGVAARKELCVRAVHKAANLLYPLYVGKHLSEEDIVDAYDTIR